MSLSEEEELTETDLAIQGLNNVVNIMSGVASNVRNVRYSAQTNTTTYYGHTNFQELKVNGNDVALASQIPDITGKADSIHTHTTADLTNWATATENFAKLNADNTFTGTNTFTKPVTVNTSTATEWIHGYDLYAPNMNNESNVILKFGKSGTDGNSASIGFQYNGNNNGNNCIDLSLHGYNHLYKFYRDRAQFTKPLSITGTLTATGNISAPNITTITNTLAGKANATHTHEIGDIYKNIIVQNQDETETTITKTLDEYIIEREDAIKALINAKANSSHTHNATEIIYKAAEGNNAAVNVKQELDNINQQLDIFDSQGQKVDILSVLFGVGASVGAVIDGGLVAAVGTLQNEIAVLQGEVATLGAEGLTSDVMDAVDSAGDVIQGGSSIWDGIKGIANAWSKFRTAAKGYINLSSIEALPLEDIPLA